MLKFIQKLLDNLKQSSELSLEETTMIIEKRYNLNRRYRNMKYSEVAMEIFEDAINTTPAKTHISYI